MPSLGGGGSARVDSLHTVTPLQGFDALGITYNFSPGVPVFGAIPHADPAIVSATKKLAASAQTQANGKPDGEFQRPVKLEWFNGHVIGENLVFEEHIANAEYMIKEVWPAYLSPEYCTRMTFDIAPKSTGPHTVSVISTGPAKCYINGNHVYDRPQEKDLKGESFYFFKSKLERRFTHQMTAGTTYTMTLEAWNTDLDILNRAPLFGKMFQGASLRFFEHVDIPQAIAAAAQIAGDSEYAAVCVGTTNEIESEGFDRDSMDLPGAQAKLIQAVAAANPKTIVVNFSGAPVTMDFLDKVPAVVQAWFPGQECGHSVARILTGMINPSGHLPMSWPKKIEDNPSFGNFPADSDIIRYEEGLDVGYQFYDRKDSPTPLFPFGFGLSYTTFEISGGMSSSTEVSPAGPNGEISVSCLVRNTGSKQGKVVVQFYLQMPDTWLGRTRPIKELKAFKKVDLVPGQEENVTVSLDKYAFSIYDAENACWRGLNGVHTVHIGISSQEISTSASFTVTQEFTWTGI